MIYAHKSSTIKFLSGWPFENRRDKQENTVRGREGKGAGSWMAYKFNKLLQL